MRFIGSEHIDGHRSRSVHMQRFRRMNQRNYLAKHMIDYRIDIAICFRHCFHCLRISRGVRANAIAPGFIMTDMTKALPEETLKQFVTMIPMRRGGEPEEVAKVALFLASDLSSYVSGQVIQVNGAMN